MNTDYLRVFAEVVRQGSINKAAVALGISAPLAKHRIDSLETEVGTRLLARSPSGVVPTGAGRLFAETAECVLETLDAGLSRVRGAEGRSCGCVRLLYQTRLVNESVGVFPRAFRKYKELHPNVEVEFTPTEASGPMTVSDAFIGFVDVTMPVSGFLLEKLPLYAAVSPDHPLAGRGPCSLGQLTPYSLVAMDQRAFSEIEPPMLPVINHQGDKVDICFLGPGYTSSYIISHCLTHVLAVALVIGFDETLARSLCMLPLEGYTYNYKIYIRLDANATTYEYAESIAKFYAEHTGGVDGSL